jgi:MoxR-like ATPase
MGVTEVKLRSTRAHLGLLLERKSAHWRPTFAGPSFTSKEKTMKPSHLVEALVTAVPQNVPLHIWGACGVGKSQLVKQVAQHLKREFIDVRAVQLDPVDFRGLPRIKDDRTEWITPNFLPTKGEGILFLDELTSAPPMTQAACYQLVLDRALGDYRIADRSRITVRF